METEVPFSGFETLSYGPFQKRNKNLLDVDKNWG